MRKRLCLYAPTLSNTRAGACVCVCVPVRPPHICGLGQSCRWLVHLCLLMFVLLLLVVVVVVVGSEQQVKRHREPCLKLEQ